MGRKIPGKKHRKVVNPEKQRAEREASLKGKINNPPSNPDDQEIPKSVLEIMKLKKNAKLVLKKKKSGKKKRNKFEKPLCIEQFLDRDKVQPGMEKPEKFIPNLVQRPEETKESFLKRVNSMTQKLIKEVEFEEKFGVKIKKNMENGKILKVEKDREGKFGRNKKNKSKKISLKEKRKEKKFKKKREEEGVDFSHLKDVVEFGEVVDRPPQNLKLPNKRTKNNSSEFKNLLLQDLLNGRNKSNKTSIQQEKEEKQRQFIITSYRERKKLNKKLI